MTTRQLTQEEKTLTQKSIHNQKKNIGWIEYQIKYYQLMLDEGLEQNYLKQRRDYEKMLKDLKAELQTTSAIIKEMEKQMRCGVEVKQKDKKEDKK